MSLRFVELEDLELYVENFLKGLGWNLGIIPRNPRLVDPKHSIPLGHVSVNCLFLAMNVDLNPILAWRSPKRFSPLASLYMYTCIPYLKLEHLRKKH